MRRIVLALVLAVACIAPARADITGGRFIITSASATSCTQISATWKSIQGVINTSTSAQTVTLKLFDDNGTCAAGDQVYGGVLAASAVVTFPVVGRWLNTGLSYTLSAAATNNIVVVGGS